MREKERNVCNVCKKFMKQVRMGKAWKKENKKNQYQVYCAKKNKIKMFIRSSYIVIHSFMKPNNGENKTRMKNCIHISKKYEFLNLKLYRWHSHV